MEENPGEETPQAEPTREEELEAEVERLKESQNRAMRAAAEYDNAAKRAQRELQDSRKFASAGLARDLLAVVDNLQRALAAVSEEEAKENEQFGKLAEGVQMIERDLLRPFPSTISRSFRHWTSPSTRICTRPCSRRPYPARPRAR